MFRSFGKRTVLARKSLIFIPMNGISANLPKRPMELNSVKLMGTIVDDIQYLKGGAIKLRIKTVTEDTGDCVHNVAIANRNLLKIVQHNLAPEQRIYIGGRLKTENFQVDYQHFQDVEILANELYLLEPNPKFTDNQTEPLPIQMDENSVEMFASVGTSVRMERNSSTFSIITHFIKQKGKPNESEDMEYHKVLVFMDPKVQRVADNLEKFDRIYLTGFINYSKENFRKHDGNEYNNGFIQPINLVKLQKFDEQ